MRGRVPGRSSRCALVRRARARVVCVARRAHAQDDFFASSPGAAVVEPRARSTTQDHCNDCHVDGTQGPVERQVPRLPRPQRPRATGSARARASTRRRTVKGKKCETCHLEHKGRGYDIMGWKIDPGRRRRTSTTISPAGSSTASTRATECADCHKAQGQARASRRTWAPTGCAARCHVKDQPHKFEATERTCSRASAATARACGSRRSADDCSSTTTTARTRLMPLLGSHKDVACTQVPPQERVQPAVPEARQLRQRRLSPEPARRPPVRQARLRVVPLADVQDAQDSRTSITRETTRFDLGPAHRKIKCYDCHTKALGEGKPNGACEHVPRQGLPPRRSVQGVRLAAALRDLPPVGRPEVHAERVQPRAQHAGSSSSSSTPRSRAGSVTAARARRTSRTSATSSTRTARSVHGLPRARQGPRRRRAPQRQVQEQRSACSATCNAGRSDDPHRQGQQDRRRGARRRAARSRWSRATRTCRAPTATPAATRRARRRSRDLKPNCNAAGQCHEDSLHKGTLGDECIDLPRRRAPGTRSSSITTSRSPTDAKGEVNAFPLKGEHKKNKCEACHPQSASSPRRRRDVRGRGLPRRRRRAQGPARRQVREVPRRDRRQHLQPQHDVGVPARRQAPRRPVRGLPPVGDVQAAPDRLLRLPPRAGGPQGPVRHRLRAVPHDARRSSDVKPLHDVGDFSLKGTHDNIACERCHKDNRPLAGSRQPVHQLPPPGRHPPQLAVAAVRRVPHAVVVRAGAVRSHAGRLQPDRPAPHARVLRLPHERQLRRAVARSASSCHRDDAIARRHRPAAPITRTRPTCASCHNPNTWHRRADRRVRPRVGVPMRRSLARRARARGGAARGRKGDRARSSDDEEPTTRTSDDDGRRRRAPTRTTPKTPSDEDEDDDDADKPTTRTATKAKTTPTTTDELRRSRT